MKSSVIAVLGAGSWGTAVAIHLATHGNQVMLWGRNPQHVQSMQKTLINSHYLPNVSFPKQLTVTHDIACCEKADYVIIAVPSHAFDDLLRQIKKPKTGLAWLTKGLDPQTNQFLSQQVAEYWGMNFPIGIISGPSFAREVAQGLPTALVLAGQHPAYLQEIHSLLHQGYMRVYESSDILGVQWCGAVKNVIAIACGISDGLQYGSNAKAALITRGLAEMSRVGVRLGGKQETFMGLAGLGDLVLTCTDDQSRNRRFGLALGRGATCQEAEDSIQQVVEGRHNATQVCAIAAQLNIEMPICQEVRAMLNGEITAHQAVTNLMTRPPAKEQ
jgi:glycerol-3-phosphate dehydrogenase (NAD(P)+)